MSFPVVVGDAWYHSTYAAYRWSAVCRGAVLKGLALANSSVPVGPDVKSRVCRYHIGTIFNVLPWEKDEHDVRDKAWCPINQEFLAVDQVKWFAKIVSALYHALQ